jgi:putative PIN family toxin of toxin-antitoxin system
MRIVLDTNVLLVSIAKQSPYRIIFDSLLAQKFNLSISNDIISEYIEIIERKTNTLIATNIAEMLLALPNVKKHEIYYKWNLISNDKDDNKFVDCAIAANADYLVSNDKHFNELKTIDFPKLSILTINDFIKLL